MEELHLDPFTVLALQSEDRRGRLDMRRAVDGEGRPLDGDPRQRLLAAAGVRRRGGASSHPCDRRHRPQPHALSSQKLQTRGGKIREKAAASGYPWSGVCDRVIRERNADLYLQIQSLM